MRLVLAAIDNSAAARPVLSVALEVGRVMDATVNAVHALGDDGSTAEAAARALDVPFTVISGPVEESLVAAAQDPAVQGIVLGARNSTAGRRPAGHVTMQVVSRVGIPAVIVPPELGSAFRLRRVIVPMVGDLASSAPVEQAIAVAEEAQLEVVVLHVHDLRSLPAFEDQAYHDAEAWSREFVARWTPNLDPRRVALEQRVGVPSEEIIRACHELEADLVVLGWSQNLSPGRSRIVRDVLTNVSLPVGLVPIRPILDLTRPEQESRGSSLSSFLR